MIRAMEYDAAIIGGGPAGMAAALSLKESGVERIVIAERGASLGGILQQCIHTGFGLHKFKEELTGPEYAERYVGLLDGKHIDVLLDSCVIDIIPSKKKNEIVVISEQHGLVNISSKAVVLAMGCREKSRGSIVIPGSRPSGIMTAGFAQKMVNIHGYLPGKEIVILGSGDIGLIMARRLTLEGAAVKAVIEIRPEPGGLPRNIVQCLEDFAIPLHLSHAITEIRGERRISSIEVAPVDGDLTPLEKDRFDIKCDALLLSVGLVPENELSLKAGIRLDDATRGPVVDSNLMTEVPGIFACGNVLHVHDIVDWVSDEAEHCGRCAAEFVKNVKTGENHG